MWRLWAQILTEIRQISPGCSLEGMMLKLKLQYFGHIMRRVDSLEKTLMLGGIWGQEEKGTAEVEMAGWHHRLNGREFEWTPGVGDGQGGLVCCNSWGCKESDTTERVNWTEHVDYWSIKNKTSKLVQDQEFKCVYQRYMQLNSFSFPIWPWGFIWEGGWKCKLHLLLRALEK